MEDLAEISALGTWGETLATKHIRDKLQRVSRLMVSQAAPGTTLAIRGVQDGERWATESCCTVGIKATRIRGYNSSPGKLYYLIVHVDDLSDHCS